VYLAAILLIGWGVSRPFRAGLEEGPRPLFLESHGPFALELVIGFGLLFHRRWAWVLGVTAAVVFVAEALRRLLFVHFEYEWTVVLIVYSAPAIVILVGLLPRRARRAFLGE
jgi:hypothetical protein